MNNRAIGVLCLNENEVKKIAEFFPCEHILALCPQNINEEDEREVLKEKLLEATNELISKGVKAVLCINPYLSIFMPSESSVPIVNSLLTGVQEACSVSNGNMGVLSGEASMKTGAYGKQARNIRGAMCVTGWYLTNPISPTDEELLEAASVFIKDNVDSVLISGDVEEEYAQKLSVYLNKDIKIIIQAHTALRSCKSTLAKHGELHIDGVGSVSYIK